MFINYIKTFKVYAILCLLCCFNTIQSSKLQYTFKEDDPLLTEEIKNTVINTLETIVAPKDDPHTHGNILIKKINGLLTKTDTNITFLIDPRETRFDFNDRTNLLIFIDTGEFKPLPSEGIGARDISLPFNTTFIVRRVGQRQNNFDSILVHELLHAKHFLENYFPKSDTAPNAWFTLENCANLTDIAKIPYETAKNMGPSYIKYMIKSEYQAKTTSFYTDLFHEISDEPVIRTTSDGKTSRFSLWDSLEERRTVCGPDIDNITENAYRRYKGYPSRYIYQGADIHFFEPTNTITSCLTSLSSGDADDTSYPFSWEWNKETSLYYTIYSIRNEVTSLDLTPIKEKEK